MVTTRSSREAVAAMFKQITLSLIGVFQIYEVDAELNKAVAKMLGRLFRRQLQQASPVSQEAVPNPMFELADEMQRVATPEEDE